jgi:hypothetical protein
MCFLFRSVEAVFNALNRLINTHTVPCKQFEFNHFLQPRFVTSLALLMSDGAEFQKNGKSAKLI